MPQMSAEWLERMRTVSVQTLAQALGLQFQPPRGSSGGALQCPACNAIRRHTKTRDKRGAAGVRRDGHGWRCFQCDVSGDGIDLIAWHLRGKRMSELGDGGKAEVRDWCVRWLGLERALPAPGPSQAHSRAPAETSIPASRRYPPSEELQTLWRSARSITTVPAVASWLANDRGLDPRATAELDLARALPHDGPHTAALPRWAGFGGENGKHWRSWPSAGLQLVVPLFDANGVMRSVLFRRTFETAEDWPPKSIGTRGFERAGLIMANTVGCHLLARPALGQESTSVVIEEGETDWLTGCLAWARRSERAIFGVVSGSWTDEIAGRMPSGAQVTIRTDNDEAGDRLAAAIAKSLGGRCKVLRGGQQAKRS